MPIQVKVDEKRGLVEVVLTGEVTEAEVGETMNRYLAGAAAALPLGLFDASGITVTDLSPDLLSDLAGGAAKHVDSRIQRGKLAVVATSDLALALGRIYQILRRNSPVEVRVFSAHEPAKRWLGLVKDGSVAEE